MSPVAETLLASVRSLPTPTQVELIEAIIAGLDEAEGTPLDSQWMAEIERRSAEYDAGLVEVIPWSEVRKQDRNH